VRAYEIKLTSPGFDSAVNNLTKMGTALDRIEKRLTKFTQAGAGIDGLTKRIEKLADQMERLGGATGAVRAGGGGARSGSGSRFISGPNQRLETIASQMPQAVLQNNVAAVADLERAKRLSERSIALDQRRKDDPEHLTRPGLLELFSQMNGLLAKLSRGDLMGAGAKIIQLGGGRNTGGGLNIQQMQAFGLSSVAGGASGGASAGGGAAAGMLRAAGPIGMVVGVVLAVGYGLKKFSEIVQHGTAVMQESADAAAALGGSIAEVAGLRGLGVSPGAAGGLGAGLRGKLSSDPFAMAIGGYQLPSHLTGQSNAPLLEAQMKRLRALYEEGKLLEMVRQERVLGLEVLHQELTASKAMRQMREKDSQESKKFLSSWPSEQRSDYALSQKRKMEAWDLLAQRFQQNWSLVATPVNNLLANITKWLAMTNFVGPDAQVNSPVAQNTSAIEELTKVLRDQLGGGPRARGALSPAQKAAIQRGMDWDTARNLGAFRL
jgi:hypothetical protein